MKTFKEYITEKPYIETSFSRERFLDLQFEDITKKYFDLKNKHNSTQDQIMRMEMQVKKELKQRLEEILMSTKDNPYEDKHSTIFYIEDATKVQDLKDFFIGCVTHWQRGDIFDQKLVEWTPMIFMDVIRFFNKKKSNPHSSYKPFFDDEEKKEVLQFITDYLRSKRLGEDEQFVAKYKEGMKQNQDNRQTAIKIDTWKDMKEE